MNCINCGREIKSEFNICPYCGKPLHIVPEYDVYDDDDINVLLESAKNVESKNNKAYQRAQKEKERQEALTIKKQNQMKKTIISVSIVCIVLLIAAIVGKLIIDKNNASSYDYQMKMADSAMFKGEIDKAKEFYLKALELEPDDVEVRLELADLFLKEDDADEAIKYLNEVIKIDATNQKAYKMLIQIYEENGDVASIIELKEGISDTKILDLFASYVVKNPEINLSEGNYTSEITITISANQGLTVFYTLDGSDPIKHGKEYKNSILIEDAGMHTLKAVAMNDIGVYSDVVTATYVIEFEAPSDPVVLPGGGEFTKETKVTINVPDGCSAYFTWDGTDPTVMSTLYVSPITIPEGYNILSVIIISDKTGLQSGIYRGAFEYYPN